MLKRTGPLRECLHGRLGKSGVVLSLVSCVLLFSADAAPRVDPAQLQLWWNFVAAIDAQYGNDEPEKGHGLVVGRFNSSALAGKKSLFIVTANHVVRRQGHPATSITVRLPWRTTQPRAARLTGLYDPVLDVAVLLAQEESDELKLTLNWDAKNPDDLALRLLVVSCPSELKASSKIRLGDVTAGVSAIASDESAGSFAGEDTRGNLIVRGLSVKRGQSGSPLIDTDGAVVAIQTQSEGRERAAIGVPIQRLVKMFEEGGYLDKKLQPISKARGEVQAVAPLEELACKVSEAECESRCGKDCEMTGDNPDARRRCTDCQSRCLESLDLRCRQRLASGPSEEVWSLKWYLVPTCHCVDAGLIAFGHKMTHENLPSLCSEPGLLTPLQTELRGDFRGLPSRLANRFPATKSDFATSVMEQSPGSAWRVYQESIRDASDTRPEWEPEESMPLEARVFAYASTSVGLPVCHRIPALFRRDAARILQLWRDDNEVKIIEVRGGISECEFQVSTVLGQPFNLPFLQVGGRWIFFPTRGEPW